MQTPLGLAGLTLVYWGWQTGYLWAGLVMALALEASRWVPVRLDWSEKDYWRAWDLTVAMYVGAAFWCYWMWPVAEALLTFFRWHPMIFFLFAAGQAWNRRTDCGMAAFFWVLRRDRGRIDRGRRVNVAFGYFAVCLWSASVVGGGGEKYYWGFCALIGWALWSKRSRRVPDVVFAGLLASLMAVGYWGNQAMRDWQMLLERRSAEWVRRMQRSAFEDQSAHTSMGRIGELKQSGRVVMQLEPSDPGRPPSLLRMASYNKLYVTTWFAARRQLYPARSLGLGNWLLIRKAAAPESARLFMLLPAGRGLLPMAPGTAVIRELPAQDVSFTPMGAVRVEGSADLVHCDFYYGSALGLDQDPTETDLLIPDSEKAVVAQVAREAGLSPEKPPRENLAALAAFFQNKFRYATASSGGGFWPQEGRSLMRSFLTETRAGHCEYFASATTLMLRQAGIATRYATGFALGPEGRVGDAYLVRERDAHAWVLAYVQGKWVNVDTTPTSWLHQEEARVSLLGRIHEWWLGRAFRFAWWRATFQLNRFMPVLLITGATALGWLMWRLWRSSAGWQRVQQAQHRRRKLKERGGELDLERIESRLRAWGLRREPHETYQEWFGRLRQDHVLASALLELEEALRWHYRLRFDPVGLNDAEKLALRQSVDGWLRKRHRLPKPAAGRN